MLLDLVTNLKRRAAQISDAETHEYMVRTVGYISPTTPLSQRCKQLGILHPPDAPPVQHSHTPPRTTADDLTPSMSPAALLGVLDASPGTLLPVSPTDSATALLDVDLALLLSPQLDAARADCFSRCSGGGSDDGSWLLSPMGGPRSLAPSLHSLGGGDY